MLWRLLASRPAPGWPGWSFQQNTSAAGKPDGPSEPDVPDLGASRAILVNLAQADQTETRNDRQSERNVSLGWRRLWVWRLFDRLFDRRRRRRRHPRREQIDWRVYLRYIGMTHLLIWFGLVYFCARFHYYIRVLLPLSAAGYYHGRLTCGWLIDRRRRPPPPPLAAPRSVGRDIQTLLLTREARQPNASDNPNQLTDVTSPPWRSLSFSSLTRLK